MDIIKCSENKGEIRKKVLWKTTLKSKHKPISHADLRMLNWGVVYFSR